MTAVGSFLFGVVFGACIMYAMCTLSGFFEYPRNVTEDGKRRLREWTTAT